MKILCTICVRAGSEGLKNKNFLKLKNKHLIHYTIETAIKSKIFTDIAVSSDSKKIIKLTKVENFQENPIQLSKIINVGEFEKICDGARRINILHGHYTPMKAIVNNKDKIHSNILHNSVDHILKSQVVTDARIGWHPWLDSKWEKEVNEWATHSIWVGLFDILIKNQVII